jgi:hypothetical protein
MATRQESFGLTKEEFRTGAKPMAYSVGKKEIEAESGETAPIQLGEIHATDGLSEAILQSFLESHLPSINGCYTGTGETLTVRKKELALSLMVDPAGWVIKVVSMEGKKKISPLETCIIQKLKSLRFPTPRTGKGVRVTITFLLH